ncbi:hypothetical protein MKEN_00920100 [Mycena kentingensis (nom. inval.)]|nr:hypothetical protein MKEN_00920100 [Mycena kentingensis (nom. inval.)]
MPLHSLRRHARDPTSFPSSTAGAGHHPSLMSSDTATYPSSASSTVYSSYHLPALDTIGPKSTRRAATLNPSRDECLFPVRFALFLLHNTLYWSLGFFSRNQKPSVHLCLDASCISTRFKQRLLPQNASNCSLSPPSTNSPPMSHLFTKSPQEHALATLRSAEKQRMLVLEPADNHNTAPQPGHVRVHFHSHLFKIYDQAPPDMVADIPLCRTGGLDLDLVRRQWGLETCLPVDPLRWKPFEPTQPNYLSPVAIQVLSKGQGYIKVIEPFVSHQTLMQRNARQVVLRTFALIHVLLTRLFDAFSDCIESDTPLPGLFRRLRRRIRTAKNGVQEQFDWTWSEVQDFLILFLWIGLALAWFGGYVEFSPRERARKWVRTGSFSL